ncbi:DJ-1/PfpI/YhbO family deglycase/protease [Halomarina salina]|uniref:DJ-1/PfpI/YhbO family deglycase/protease n=1 Tax=Halomarina salina TaxID=1872699 RepID=A0ABD5RMI0_9EURY|nr:type 1 glutamine amidotransferase domain-containing protein [Halomarina salina]
MSQSLSDTTVAILLAPRGTEEPEFTEPRDALTDAGATVEVVGVEAGEVQTVNNDLEPGGSYEVEKTFSEVSADDYDGLVVPGGSVGADDLRGNEEAVEFVRQFVESDRPTGVICHGPWLLAEADVLDGRTVTSFHSIETDLRNAGAEWVDEEVVVDGHLVTSRNPDDLDAFCEAVVEQLEQASR